LSAPAGASSFSLRDWPPAGSNALVPAGATNLTVQVNGLFNPQIGRVEWRLACLDTKTGRFPTDALAGLLPPENGTGRGQGHVRFRVKPKVATPLGTDITNTATIVFDGAEPIPTPPVWNVVGDVPALVARVAYLPGEVRVGVPLSYTVALTNTGLASVEKVILTNTLPSGVTLENATATSGRVGVTGGTVVWNVDHLGGGVGASLTVTVLPTREGAFANIVEYSGGSGLAIYSAPTEFRVGAAARPSLSVRFVDGQVELAWPVDTAEYVLQRAAQLGDGAVWESVAATPTIAAQEYRLAVEAGHDAAFYRLVKP